MEGGDGRADEGAEAAARRDRRALGIGALGVALIAVPLVVAVAVLSRPRWYPILDLAMTELRVRDVGTRHTPLIGLPGRIGSFGAERGSHPGPLSFWLLAPTYRLFGSSAWALFPATAVLHLGAVATSCWLAWRRGRTGVLLGTIAALSLLVLGYGTEFLTQPWNPYMPLLWWFVVLLAVWSVLCRDLVALPVAVFAGSLCAQTHVPYAGLAGGMGALAAAGLVWEARRRPPEGIDRRHLVRWVVLAAVLGAVLWTAPVIDHLTADHSNLSKILDHLASPSEEPVGRREGVKMVLLHLDPIRFVTQQGAATGSLSSSTQVPPGSLAPGVILLAVWAAAVAGAWRIRHQVLLRLHAVVGVGLLLAVYSISRIFGELWYYLMTWMWGLTALLVLGVVWTAVEVASARATTGPPPRLLRLGAAGLVALTLVTTVVSAVDAAHAEVPAVPLVRTMAAITPDTVDALADGDQPGRGFDERYLVVWSDTLYIGAQGVALVNELDRAGFDVGAEEAWGPPVTVHRVRARDEATSFVVMANGPELERLRSRPEAVEIASFEPRTPAEQDRFARLRAEVLDELAAAGLDDVAALVDTNLFAAAIDGRVPEATQEKLTVMHDLGLPTGVFVGPQSILG